MGWMGYYDLQDVSSRDFERLLAYMYHGEVIIYIIIIISMLAIIIIIIDIKIIFIILNR